MGGGVENSMICTIIYRRIRKITRGVNRRSERGKTVDRHHP